MGARPGYKVRLITGIRYECCRVMNTRSQSNKSAVEDLYKTAITSTPAARKPRARTTSESHPASKQVDFVLHDIVVSDITPITINTSATTAMIESPQDHTQVTMTTNPFATLKYAVEAVPFFDGSNIPLSYFIEGCEEAKSMLPAEVELQFTKIIRTRIMGEARRTIQGQNFDTVAQLTTYLKQIYGPVKNAYQLQGELGSVYQKINEDVVMYANRVKALGKQILEAYKTSGHMPIDSGFRTSLEKDMAKCFIRGLKPEIEQRIIRDLDIYATIADALRIERELSMMTDLRKGTNIQNHAQGSNKTMDVCQICYKVGHIASDCRKLSQNKMEVGNEILICQICKKRGHSADKCRLRDPQARNFVKTVQGNAIICQLCSRSGHNAKACQNDKNNIKPNLICQWCDKPGHAANNCWKKQNSANNPRIICQMCNNIGHSAKECRAGSVQKSVDKIFCHYCKKQGHMLNTCQLRLANNNRIDNRQGNYQGPSKSGAQQGTGQVAHPTISQPTN